MSSKFLLTSILGVVAGLVLSYAILSTIPEPFENVPITGQATLPENKIISKEKFEAKIPKIVDRTVKEKKEPVYADDELIVKFKSNVDDLKKNSALKKNNAKVKSEIKQRKISLISVEHGSLEKVKSDLSKDPNVEYVEKNEVVEIAMLPNDPFYYYQWHLDQIRAFAAWDATVGDPNVKIAILDTGFDVTHPDLAGSLLVSDAYNSAKDNQDIVEECLHGTSTAGTAAAVTNNNLGVSGISWKNKIIPVKITSPIFPCGATTFATSNAIYYAADKGAKVVSLSFSFHNAADPVMMEAAKYVYDKGGWLVISGGNDGVFINQPDNPYVINVAATDWDDKPTYFSAYGPYIDFAAPGHFIYTTKNRQDQNGDYTYISGTSFSAPLTAGLIALMFSVNKSLSPADVYNILKSNSVDLETPGYDYKTGWGRIEAKKAVFAAASKISGGTTPTNYIYKFDIEPNNIISMRGSSTPSKLLFKQGSTELRECQVSISTPSTINFYPSPYEYYCDSYSNSNDCKPNKISSSLTIPAGETGLVDKCGLSITDQDCTRDLAVNVSSDAPYGVYEKVVNTICNLGNYSKSEVESYVVYVVPYDFKVGLSSKSNSTKIGGSVSTKVSVTDARGPVPIIPFACFGLPAGATCSFTPSYITDDEFKAGSLDGWYRYNKRSTLSSLTVSGRDYLSVKDASPFSDSETHGMKKIFLIPPLQGKKLILSFSYAAGSSVNGKMDASVSYGLGTQVLPLTDTAGDVKDKSAWMSYTKDISSVVSQTQSTLISVDITEFQSEDEYGNYLYVDDFNLTTTPQGGGCRPSGGACISELKISTSSATPVGSYDVVVAGLDPIHGQAKFDTYNLNVLPLIDKFPNVSVSISPLSPVSSQMVAFVANATDDVGLTKIEIFVDGKSVGNCNLSGTSGECIKFSGPYLEGTSHNYKARAVDTKGHAKNSTVSTFSVKPGEKLFITLSHAPPFPSSSYLIKLNATTNTTAPRMQMFVDGNFLAATERFVMIAGETSIASDGNYVTFERANSSTQAVIVVNGLRYIVSEKSLRNLGGTLVWVDDVTDDVGIEFDSALISIGGCTTVKLNTCVAYVGPYPAGSNHTYYAVAWNDMNQSTRSSTNSFKISSSVNISVYHSPIIPTSSQIVIVVSTTNKTVFRMENYVDGVLVGFNERFSIFAGKKITTGDGKTVLFNKAISSTEAQLTVNGVVGTIVENEVKGIGGSLIRLEDVADDVGTEFDTATIVIGGCTDIAPNTCFSDSGPYAIGSHTYYAIAKDYSNTTYKSKTNSFTVIAPPTDNPPTVVASHSPASPTSSDLVTITAGAFDDLGLKTIRVFVDDYQIGPDCSVSGTDAECVRVVGPFSAGSTHSYNAIAIDTSSLGSFASPDNYNFTVQSSGPQVHMQDTTASSGTTINVNRSVIATYVSPSSFLVGKNIDSITMKMRRIGSLTGNVEVGVFNSDGSIKKLFGMKSASALTTSQIDYTFTLPNPDLYTMQSGDRIGAKYSGGDAANYVSVMRDTSPEDPFDGQNTYLTAYNGSWSSQTSFDLYMTLQRVD